MYSRSKYVLSIRQQPEKAKVCGIKERDRRPIDPPPIVQIKLADASSDRNKNYLQSPYLFMCCNLVHAGEPEGDIVAPAHRALAGTVVSSLNRLKDVDNSDGGFFVFGDMSVRMEGHFILRFTLFELAEGQVVHIMSVLSNPMTVHSSKTFPGMSESTFLSRSFSDQGVRIRIRKDHHVKPKRPLSIESDSPELPTMHSPPSSCHEGDHSDYESNSRPTKKVRSVSRVQSSAPSAQPYSMKHVAITARPREARQGSYESSERTPPSSPGSYIGQDPYPSRSHNRPHTTEDPSWRRHGPAGRQPFYAPSLREPSRPGQYPPSSYFAPHPFYSSPYNNPGPHDSEMHSPPHSSSSSSITQEHHSRTPSISSHHSEHGQSPPHPFSSPESQPPLSTPPGSLYKHPEEGAYLSPSMALPSIMSSISMSASERIQLPPLHMLSTRSPPLSMSSHYDPTFGEIKHLHLMEPGQMRPLGDHFLERPGPSYYVRRD
ncbi:hypothetical protein BG006_006355 [Podila minutissima]|uniref:Velvet domain-containing protein n=1 Tax=Podila minutissima TaxID=64525 RepID=A0A9P5VLH2_9FUNG|nr:hypothetical protein BG006_006355 [Podila minutissima]